MRNSNKLYVYYIYVCIYVYVYITAMTIRANWKCKSNL